MIYTQNGRDYIDVLDGVKRKTLVYGEKTLLAEFRLTGGKTLPLHSHPQEQTGYLISGKLSMTIGGERHLFLPGAGWSIPGGTEHGVEIIEDSVVVEVFSPVREDYLPCR